MQEGNRYPSLNLGSKNEIAKRISSKSFPQQKALALINDVLDNFDDYWRDSKRSQPERRKFVRSAVGTPLEKLLKKIDRRILKPHDNLVPGFIFGGISGKNHIHAAYSLLGKQRKRVLIGLDISRFFEQIQKSRVFYFFHKKCDCGVRASRLLARLCCVPVGQKGSESKKTVLARGFSTSSRLAVWTNLETFLRLKWTSSRLLKGHDSKIVVFVDDIGVTASRISKLKAKEFSNKLKEILSNFDKNQKLPINKTKTNITSFAEGAEHLGLRLGKRKITMGSKSKAKRENVKKKLSKSSGPEKRSLLKAYKSYHRYHQQIKSVYQNT